MEKTMIDIYEASKVLQRECHLAAKNAGWWTDISSGKPTIGIRNVPELLCLVHSEISEAMEGYRKNLMDDKLTDRPMIEVELADAVIRIFDIAGGMGYDVAGAIVAKMEYNSTRSDHKIENRKKDGGKKF